MALSRTHRSRFLGPPNCGTQTQRLSDPALILETHYSRPIAPPFSCPIQFSKGGGLSPLSSTT